jgi:hypothetical protein
MDPRLGRRSDGGCNECRKLGALRSRVPRRGDCRPLRDGGVAAGIGAQGVGSDGLRAFRLDHADGDGEAQCLPGVPGASAGRRTAGTAGGAAVAGRSWRGRRRTGRASRRAPGARHAVGTRTGVSGSRSRPGCGGALGCAGGALASAGTGSNIGGTSRCCWKALSTRDTMPAPATVLPVGSCSERPADARWPAGALARPGRSYHSTPRQVWVKPLGGDGRDRLCAVTGISRP